MNNAQIKKMNDQPINGEILAGLIKNYVDTINHKDIPNIENAWDYICRDQCQKAYEESFDDYDKGMKEYLNHQWPVSVESLKNLHNECYKLAVKEYQQKALGHKSKEFLAQLRENMD